jgi:hypothetical protein
MLFDEAQVIAKFLKHLQAKDAKDVITLRRGT